MRLVDRRRKTNCVNTRELRRTKHLGAVEVEYKRGTFRDYPGSFIGLSWVEPKKKEKSPAQDTTNLKQVYHFSETIHRGIDTASNSNQGSDFFRVGGFISGLWRREEGGIEGGGTGFIEKTCRYPPHSATTVDCTWSTRAILRSTALFCLLGHLLFKEMTVTSI